ncbi:MAG TPA: hypothetical protein PLH22_02865 [Candidatus Colwellbacteria bacterium]|nr:hypothetical protein [Candidatus Colwellbacteria bacterium]
MTNFQNHLKNIRKRRGGGVKGLTLLEKALTIAFIILTIQKSVVFAWQNPTQNPPGGGGSFVIESGAPTNVIYIKADGKVGIGMTNPATKLDVSGGMIKMSKATATDNGSPGLVYVHNDDFLFNGIYINHYGFGFHSPDSETPGYTGAYMSGYYGLDLFTGGVSRVHILNNGNIGIGTVFPTTYLDIRGNSQAMSASNNGIFNIFSTDATAIDKGGSIALGGQSNADVFTTFGKIIGFKENVTSGNTAGFLAFGTRPNGGTINERMRITSTGNVGIGTITPGAKLEVNGNAIIGADPNITATTIPLRINGLSLSDGTNPYGNYAGILFDANDGYTSGARRYLITNALDTNKFGIIRSVNQSTDPALGTAGAITSGTADLVIDNAGKVGIGTAAPGYKLEVSGDILNRGKSYQYTSLGQGSGAHGISWYSPAYYTWYDYMAPPGTTNSPSGTAAPTDATASVTSWARRFNIENASGYGWIFESGSNASGSAPTVKFAISSNTGNFHSIGSGTIDGALTVTGNANICNLVSYTGGGGSTQCPAGFYTWSGVALTSGYMLCCKVSNPI